LVKKRIYKVVFATGILFVLTLAVFGSLSAVATLRTNNIIDVAPEGHVTEDTAALAWRIDPSVVRVTDFKADPGEVRTIDFKLDPGGVRMIH
jgi:hypothetical protein